MASTSTTQNPSPDYPKQYNDSVYIFYDPGEVRKIEIIFFHDVLWKDCEEPHIQSWMSRGASKVCWPEVWLKLKYPEARILSVRYDAEMQKSNKGGYLDLFQVAENLKQDILEIYEGNRPLVLVAHGFGGLIIKKLVKEVADAGALTRPASNSEQANNNPYKCKEDCFVENVKGVFYYAPSFMGSTLADSMKGRPNVGSLVKFLEVFNEEISRLNNWFSSWRQRGHCKAIGIGATHPTKWAVESNMVTTIFRCLEVLLCIRESSDALTLMVAEGSSRYDVDEYYNSARDHFNICKPLSETDSSFHMLLELIDEVISTTARQISTIVESPSDDFVDKTLSRLPQLDVISLDRNELMKTTHFREKYQHLMDGLKEAGFERISRSAGKEFWKKYET
ncbi:unnamed protein product [Calypogeia fissa]